MLTYEDAPLRVEEITQQLERLFASQRFQVASNQADFLRLVVERTLKGQKTTENTIGRLLFPKFIEDESTDVRVTARNLRRSLNKYYEHEGRLDPVIIYLPDPPADKSLKPLPGEAYKPCFSHNPRHAAAKECVLGEHYTRRGYLDDLERGVRHFTKALQLNPLYLRAMLGMAEILCAFGPLVSREQAAGNLSLAATGTENALRLAPNYWRSHAARATFHFMSNEPTLAEAEFRKALTLDEAKTERYEWYIQFLSDTRQNAEAVRLAKRHLDERLDDPAAHTLYAACVYKINPEEGEKAFEDALRIDRNYWAIHATRILSRAVAKSEIPSEPAERLKALLDERTYNNLMTAIKAIVANH